MMSVVVLSACNKVEPIEFFETPDTVEQNTVIEEEDEALLETELPDINDSEIIIQPDF